jgi:hypothetical protein
MLWAPRRAGRQKNAFFALYWPLTLAHFAPFAGHTGSPAAGQLMSSHTQAVSPLTIAALKQEQVRAGGCAKADAISSPVHEAKLDLDWLVQRSKGQPSMHVLYGGGSHGVTAIGVWSSGPGSACGETEDMLSLHTSPEPAALRQSACNVAACKVRLRSCVGVAVCRNSTRQMRRPAAIRSPMC